MMFSSNFFEMELGIKYFDDLFNSGSEEFEYIFRYLLNNDDPELYKKVEGNPATFREPLICTYYNKVFEFRFPLDQLVFGYISNEENKTNKLFHVKSDNKGIVYIPRFGYFDTERPDDDFHLKYDTESGCTICEFESDKLVKSGFKPVEYISNSSIEVNQKLDPVIAQFFENEEDLKIGECQKKYTKVLGEALDFIRNHFPYFYDWLEKGVSNIVLYESDTKNSFASLFIKGTAFINTKNQLVNKMFFIEEITHQCGHAIFYAMSINKEELFNCEITTPMAKLTGLEYDRRDILNAFYAFFPQLYGNAIFAEASEKGLIKEQEFLLELKGRLAFRMYKYGKGVKQFMDIEEQLSDSGKEMFAYFRDGFFDIDKRWRTEFDKLDISDQKYNFDLNTFKNKNKSLSYACE